MAVNLGFDAILDILFVFSSYVDGFLFPDRACQNDQAEAELPLDMG
ncbi:hypothetical protein [Geobacter sp.]|nr:hypothetical protein [Geobacter sp.]